MLTINGYSGLVSPQSPRPCPLVKLSLSSDFKWAKDRIGAPRLLESELVGLIDTGADHCRIDNTLVQRHNLPKLPPVTSVNIGVPVRTDVTCAILYFTQCGFVDIETMPTGDFRRAGLGFDVIIGMTFLRLFDVHIRMKDNLVQLHFVGE
jgi:hypothetical protein